MTEQGQKRKRVVLVPLPFQGHISPMLDLGSALYLKGFSITVVHTNFNSPNPLNHPDFTFSPIDDGLTDIDISSLNLNILITTIITKSQAPLEERLITLMDQEGVACIIYDAAMNGVENVAEHLKLPSIIFNTCSVAAMAAFAEMDRLYKEGYFPLEESKLQDLVPGLDPLRVKDIPITKFIDLESQLTLIATYGKIRRALSVIWNTIDCLEHLQLADFQEKHQIPCFSVGPLFKTSSTSSSSLLNADQNCITWLDKQTPKSVLYISLGSLVFINKKELAEMAWGLAKCGQPFLWVIRPGSVQGSKWIELLPEGFTNKINMRGLIVKWAPQKEVLAHKSVGGFWSHCGWNSTLESISEGVPIICSPGFADQNVNARYASYVWKVGLEMEGEIERSNIEKLVKRLMIDEEGKQVRKRATDFKEKVQVAISEAGSSYTSFDDLANFILSL